MRLALIAISLVLAPVSSAFAQTTSNPFLPQPTTSPLNVDASVQMTTTLPTGEAATVFLDRSINVSVDRIGAGAGTDNVNAARMQTPRGLFVMSSVNYAADAFSFECAGAGGRFAGTYNKDAQGYVGTWHVAGKSSPMTLRENVPRVDVTFP